MGFQAKTVVQQSRQAMIEKDYERLVTARMGYHS